MAIKNQEKGQFKPGQSGNPNGRPRKYVSTLTDQGYKLSEINDTIQAMMAMSLDELKKVYQDKEATILEKTIAHSMQKGLKNGNLSSMETLLTRVYGRPKEKLETEGTNTNFNVDLSGLSTKDLLKLIEKGEK